MKWKSQENHKKRDLWEKVITTNSNQVCCPYYTIEVNDRHQRQTINIKVRFDHPHSSVFIGFVTGTRHHICLESYNQGLSNKTKFMTWYDLVVEISLKQCKSTKYLISFLRHCISRRCHASSPVACHPSISGKISPYKGKDCVCHFLSSGWAYLIAKSACGECKKSLNYILQCEHPKYHLA